MFENRVLRKTFGPKRDEVTGSGEDYIRRSILNCTSHRHYSGGYIKNNEIGGACGM
jgi:hypothetical protein